MGRILTIMGLLVLVPYMLGAMIRWVGYGIEGEARLIVWLAIAAYVTGQVISALRKERGE